MRTKPLYLALGIGVMSLSTAAAGRDGSRVFERLDADGDGAVTQAELTARREQLFDRIDSDDDGVVSASEREAAKGRGERIRKRFEGAAEEHFESTDTDGDGKLTHAEFMAAPHPLLGKADADGNGVLTREEFDRFTAQARSRAR